MTLRLGMVDCDTSHVVAFTQRINHVGVAEDHWVEGARVVGAVSLPSAVSPERVGPFTDQLREYGVPIFERPESLLGEIDAVMIEAVDGSVHLERALPFVEAGVPLWVEKPFTCSTAEARRLVDAAAGKGVPLLSASALRFDLPVQDVLARRGELGAVLGAEAYTPGPEHPRNPGFFHYAVHGVEMLYALLGAGCRRVRCVPGQAADVAVGEWGDGRLGTVRAIREGAQRLGFTAYAEKGVVQAPSSPYFYRELLRRIIATFESGESPVSGDELVEVVAFQEAANESKRRGGEPVDLPTGTPA